MSSRNSVQSPAFLRRVTLGDTDKTIYVNATTGNDASGNGSLSAPFKTLQKAYDSIPFLVVERAVFTIQLADGIYDENYLSGAEMPRPAILFTSGKWLRSRTDRSGGGLTGAVVIKGNPTNPENVVLQTTSEYGFGVYNGQGQLAIENLHIKGGAGHSSGAMLVSHRNDSYIHTNNVTLDGVDKTRTSYGAYAESGGQLEITGSCDVKNNSIGIGCLTASDTISLSDDVNIHSNNTGVLAKHGGCVLLTNTNGAKRGIKLYSNSAYDIDAYNGANIETRGKDGTYKTDVTKSVECGGKVRIGDGSTVSSIWTRFIGVVENFGHMYFNNCAHQARIENSGKIRLTATDSFISPNTTNDDTLCIFNRFGGEVEHDNTSNVGAGDSYGENIISTVNGANNVTLNIFANSKACFVNGNGANRTGWIMPLVFTDTGLPIPRGFIMSVWGSSWGVEITGNVDGSVTIGNGTGQKGGAQFIFDGTTWRILGIGVTR